MYDVYQFTAPIVGHVGDGNFHCLMLVDASDQKEIQLAHELSARLARQVCISSPSC